MQSNKTASTGELKQEAGWWEGNSRKGQVARVPDVFFVPGGEGNVPQHVSAMAKLLRKQHAIREQNRRKESVIQEYADTGSFGLSEKAYQWVADQIARTRRLLLCRVC